MNYETVNYDYTLSNFGVKYEKDRIVISGKFDVKIYSNEEGKHDLKQIWSIKDGYFEIII